MQEQHALLNSAMLMLSYEAQKTIRDDVFQRSHIEACGLLLGQITPDGQWHIAQALPLPNVAASPVYFEFTPEDLLESELRYPGQIVGVYHSHPTGFPHASDTDRQNMQRVNQDQHIPWSWLIVCGPFNDAFLQNSQAGLPLSALIAYHHYARSGLTSLPIILQSA